MRPIVFGLIVTTTVAVAVERTITIRDDVGKGLTGAEVEAILTPAEDPRLASVVVRKGVTDSRGCFKYEADEAMILTRVRARRAGHHAADADHRHGLGRVAQANELTLTLPRESEQVPLHYREVRLSRLPCGQRIGFDAEAADVVAPWGKGKTIDFELEITSQQDGWMESTEALAELRRIAEGARMDDQEWAETYGRFRGSLRLSFPRRGDGLKESTAFWPYCRLKMPAMAPDDGYAGERSFAFDTLDVAPAPLAGCYLRLRTQTDVDGQPASAHYAKIQGPIIVGPGRVAFRFYYNPRAGDRRLAMDVGRNLLRPPPGATPREQERFQAFDP